MASPDSEFLVRASETAFDVGADGYRVSAVTISSRKLVLTDTGAAPGAPVYAQGEPPAPGRAGRREYDWTPAPEAPSWMHMAWLLEDMATWVESLADEGVRVVGFESPSRDWCDVLLRDGDSPYRVRIGLMDREEPLGFPGMYLRDLFVGGRHRDHLAPEPEGGTPVVDLRRVL